MDGADSFGSNQECRIGYTHSHSRVSQCLASIRKLGIRRSSEGLRSLKPSKRTNLFILIILAGDIEMNPGPRFQCGLCKKHCKAPDRLLECEECEKRFHAACLNLGDNEHATHDVASYVNNKDEDQPVHPRSPISTFVVRCLDSIIPVIAKSKISRL